MSTRRFRRIQLLDEGVLVEPLPGGVMLSTKPRMAVDTRGQKYIIKGDTLDTVVAESLGYALAELVSLPTPEWGLAAVRGSSWFASRLVEFRHTEAILASRLHVNHTFLGSLVVFDQWIGNADRNVNNIVARIPSDGVRGEAELVAIDFEKAYVLRGESQFTTFARSPRDFLPREFLRALVPSYGDVDHQMLRRIQGVTHDQLSMLFGRFHRVEDGLFPPLSIAWSDTGISHLMSRARRIADLVKEAYGE